MAGPQQKPDFSTLPDKVDFSTLPDLPGPVEPTKPLPGWDKPLSETTSGWGAFGKALLPQNLIGTGLKYGTGILQGAVADLPGNLWEGAKLLESLTPPGAMRYMMSGEEPPIIKTAKGLKELPSHIYETGRMSGSKPQEFGRMVGQTLGQFLVTEGLAGGIPGVPSPIPPTIRAVGRPVEATGRIIRKHQPITGLGARIAGGTAGAHLGGPAGAVVGTILAKAPRTLRNIESGIGGLIERGGQKMRGLGINPDTIPLEEFWGRNSPQSPITRMHGQTIIDSSDPFSRTPTSTAVSDADALKDFYGGPKGVPIEPEGININTESDPMSRAPFAQSDIDALQDFYGGDKPPLRTPPPTTVGDFSDPFSRTPITPSETVTPPEGMVSMEGRGSIDVQQGTPVTETPVIQTPVTPTQAPPKLIPSRNLTPEQKAALLAQGYTPIVQKGVPYFQEPKLAGQPALTSVEPSPARPGAHEPLPQDTSVEDLTGALQNEMHRPMPESMWEQAKRLARDESGELDIEVFQKAYERLKKGFGLKPGEMGGRIVPFAPKPRQVYEIANELHEQLNKRIMDDPRVEQLFKEAEDIIMQETDPVIIEDNFRQAKGFADNPRNSPDQMQFHGDLQDVALDKLNQSRGDKFGPQPDIPPPDKWDIPNPPPSEGLPHLSELPQPEPSSIPEGGLTRDVMDRGWMKAFQDTKGVIPEGMGQETIDKMRSVTPNELQIPTRPDSPPFPESELEMSDVANQAGERSFKWNEGPPAPDMTEPGLPFGPMELRQRTQLENIANALQDVLEELKPPVQQRLPWD